MGALRSNWLMNRGIALCIAVCILSVLAIPFAASEEEPESIVSAVFDIQFVTGTEFTVDISMNAQKLTTDRPYTSEQIKNADAQEMGALRYALFLLLKNQLNPVFEDAEFLNFEMPIFDGEIFSETLTIKLTPSFFNINETINIEELVNGVLDIGAVVRYIFNLQAEHGWNNTYTFDLSTVMNLDSANTSNVNPYTNEVTWTLKNRDGTNPFRVASLGVRSKYPTTTGSDREDISIDFQLDASNVDLVTLQADIIASHIDISNYHILPDFIMDLDIVPSDGIRLFIENDLLSWDLFYQNTINPIEQIMIFTIENSSFDQQLDMIFEWDSETTINCSSPYNITRMNDDPPIKTMFLDEDISLRICNISARALFGLINAGARANISIEDLNFGNALDGLGRQYEVFLTLPQGLSLEGQTIYTWNKTTPLSGSFNSELKPNPEYSKENIETIIELDLQKMDLNIGSLFTGKTELTTTAEIREMENHYVMVIPSELTLSDKIELTYLNADAYRLCAEESAFHTENINNFLTNKKNSFETRSSAILNGLTITGSVDQEKYTNSLDWDGDISAMDDAVPIVVPIKATVLSTINLNVSLWPPDIQLADQLYAFTTLENQKVTYRVIVPKGITIQARDTSNKSIINGTTSDGRNYIELIFDPSEELQTDLLTCEFIMSPLYILGLLFPCLLSFVLLVVLIIVIVMIRKKRRGRIISREPPEETGYEEQDYYVPPPPHSK